MKKILRRVLLGSMLACLISPALAADDWPNKPVRVIVPSSPGGGTDLYARLLTQELSRILDQTFVVDNRPGASGLIGADAVAKAAPDGYTILVASNSSIGISPGLYNNLPFDADTAFTPIARGVMAPMVLVVNRDEPYQSLQELVDAGKSGKDLFYGSAGVASAPYLGVRMIDESTGTDFIHVPYKGVGPGVQDLLAGRLQFMMPDVAAIQAFIADGRLRPLAVNQRTDVLPNVPTFKEAGVDGMDAVVSFSILGPAGMPPEAVSKLSQAVNEAMRQPALAQRLKELVLEPVFDTPEEFAASLDEERQMWADFIKRNNITPE